MSPVQMSAQFAAYLWFLRQPENLDQSWADAHRFARENRDRFRPAAHPGLGRLLLKMAGPASSRSAA